MQEIHRLVKYMQYTQKTQPNRNVEESRLVQTDPKQKGIDQIHYQHQKNIVHASSLTTARRLEETGFFADRVARGRSRFCSVVDLTERSLEAVQIVVCLRLDLPRRLF